MNPKCYKSVNSDLGKLGDQARLSGFRNGMDPFLYFGSCIAVIGVAFDGIECQAGLRRDFLVGPSLSSELKSWKATSTLFFFV